MTDHTHRAFFTELLRILRVPVRTSPLRALSCVSIYESSKGQNHWFNPLACTNFWPGAKPYNTFGDNQHVWIYPSFEAGVAATAQLFGGPHWAGVRTALADPALTRNPMLDVFSSAYSWAKVDFRTLRANDTLTLETRLNLVLH